MTFHTVSPVPSAANTYFAGSNTASGFVSRYPDIFTESALDSLTVVKGGPGTGKSTFMRNLCDRAEVEGIIADAYLCGSDPSSIDALVLRRGAKTAAVIDATPPHPFDPRLPGAVSDLFDLGAFWDRSALRAHRAEIAAHAEAKSRAYARAYRYLSALAAVRRDRRTLTEGALDRSKMTAACARFADSLDRFAPAVYDAPPLPHVRIASAVSMSGFCSLDLTADRTVVSVNDPDSASPAFLSALAAAFTDAGVPFAELRDPVEPDVTSALLLDDRRLVILPSDGSADPAKTVNLSRFLSRDSLRETRNKRTFARRLASAMEEGASEALAEAGAHHFALEEIYRSVMDFAALSAECEKRITDILSSLD